MFKKQIIFMMVFLLLAYIIAFYAQEAFAVKILVINTSPFGRCCRATLPVKPKFPGGYKDALLSRIGYPDVTEFIDDVGAFDAEWKAHRNEYDALITAYHGLRDSADFQAWVDKNKNDLEAWVKQGGAIIATTKDAQDHALVKIFGIDFISGDPGKNKAILPIKQGTPISKTLKIDKLDTSKSDDPSFWDGHHYPKNKWPKWVEFAVLEGENGLPATIAGHYEKGALIFSGAEINNLDMGNSEVTPGYLEFYQALLTWAAGPPTSVDAKDKLSTSWGKIKSSY
ncbi:TPA: hypothetical protein EYP66_08900 [Candidatus Poribacteria bacterium]|nr:hypothetical protein [Candidatus Poribacteria bacterium]